MMEQSSYQSDDDFASLPSHPVQFRLASVPAPLAGMDDTYWIARATWADGQSAYEGFLIYSDAEHYLFLDQEEARTAARMICGGHGSWPKAREIHAENEVSGEEATERQKRHDQTTPPTGNVATAIAPRSRLFSLSGLLRMLLALAAPFSSAVGIYSARR